MDGAKRMQVLINDLLAFSRVGRLTREHVEIGADELIDQAVANLALAIEESGATVTVAEGMPLGVGGRAAAGRRVPEPHRQRAQVPGRAAAARSRSSWADAGDEWEFSVADNGIGIEPEYADRIFVIFQRLHPKDAYPGTGIGLAMCRKIVEYHGGRIWLDTSVASGTVFRFTLPKIAAPPSEEESETAG